MYMCSYVNINIVQQNTSECTDTSDCIHLSKPMLIGIEMCVHPNDQKPNPGFQGPYHLLDPR